MAVPELHANFPGPGSIGWDAFNIQYEGNHYAVESGVTSERWTWWRLGATTAESGPTFPADLTDDDVLLFANREGVPYRMQDMEIIDGDMIVDGSIGAKSMAADFMQASFLLANDALIEGLLQVGSTVSRAVATEGLTIGNQTWDNERGLVIPDVVQFPPDDATAALIRAHTIARSLTIENYFRLQGRVNEIADGAALTLSNGVTAPKSKPLNETYYPTRVQLKSLDASLLRGLSSGGDSSGTPRWYSTITALPPSSGRIQSYDYTTGEIVKTLYLSTNTSQIANPIGGVLHATVNGVPKVFCLAYDSVDESWYIYRADASLNAIETRWKIFGPGQGPKYDPVLTSYSSTIFSVVYVSEMGSENRVVRRYYDMVDPLGTNYATHTLGPISSRHLVGFVANGQLPGSITSSTPGGVVRHVVWPKAADPEVLTTDYAAGQDLSVNQTAQHGFPRPYGKAIRGAEFGSVLDTAGTVYGLTNNSLDGCQTAYSFKDANSSGTGMHETDLSPASVVSVPKGASVKITPTPPPFTGGVDSPNRSKIYTKTATGVWRELQNGEVDGLTLTWVGVSVITDLNSTYPRHPSFVGAGNLPAELYSAFSDGLGALIKLQGNGAGRMGPWEWNELNQVVRQPAPDDTGWIALSLAKGGSTPFPNTSATTITKQRYRRIGKQVFLDISVTAGAAYNPAGASHGNQLIVSGLPAAIRPGDLVYQAAFMSEQPISIGITTGGDVTWTGSARPSPAYSAGDVLAIYASYLIE